MDKYEEALERAKELHEAGNALTKLQMEIVFPELKQSEDERIRTRLIALVEAFGQGEYKDEMLAYLERQKDERELGFIEGKVEGVRQTCQEIKDAMSLFEPKDLTPFEFTFRDYIDSAIRYCLSGEGYQQYIKEWAADLLNLERQKEQKPESCDCSRDEESYINGIHHVLMNPEAYGLIKQKPAEWRDTDMKEARDNLISVCRDWERGEHTTLLPIVAVRARYFLEHLTEPKPAEWSEENEKIYNEALGALYYKDCNDKDDVLSALKGLCDLIADKRKVIPPYQRWKPSGEQMEAVEEALEFYSGTTNTAKGLRSLYNDLKKL